MTSERLFNSFIPPKDFYTAQTNFWLRPCDAARREPRSVEVEFVDFDDQKICQTCKDKYQKSKRHRKGHSPIDVVRRRATTYVVVTMSYVTAHPTSYDVVRSVNAP